MSQDLTRFNRRSLLKFFGAGAAIAPVVNGLPEMSSSVKLLEEPKILIAKEMPTGPHPLSVAQALAGAQIDIRISMRTGDGKHFSFSARAINVSCQPEFINVCSLDSPMNQPMTSYAPGLKNATYDLSGAFLTDWGPK